MKNLISLTLIGFMIASVLQAQSGGGGTSGSGSPGSAQGTPPPTPQTPPPQGNVNPQTNQGAVNPQTNQGAVNPLPNQTAVNPLLPPTNQPMQASFAIGGINQTPWFADPNVQAQLKLTPSQVAQLNKLYAQDWQRFTANTPQTGAVLNDQQQQQRMQQLTNSFITDFTTASNSILNPDQRTRFTQLWTQFRGFNVFTDPQIQSRLQLTSRQMQSIRQLDQQYNQALANITRIESTDPTGAATQLVNIRKDFNNKLSGLFTDSQRQIWMQLVGDPFTFTIR